YYFRDAHRVAQIVNREVRSYNRVAVDTRRRMADRARREADEATDARRLQEIRAIRAAQAARSAEARLRQAQTDPAAAKQRELHARQDAPVIEAQIKDANDNVAQQTAQVEALQQQLQTATAATPKDPDLINRLTAQLVEARVRRGRAAAAAAALTQQQADF